MKIGFILEDLLASQLNFYIINTVNRILAESNKHDFVLFYEELAVPFATPQCATLNICEIYPFDGLLIGTRLDHAARMANMASQARKVFYVWDLEWMRGKTDFTHNMKGYRAEGIEVVTRSPSYAEALQYYANLDNVPVYMETELGRLFEDYES